MTCPGEHVDGLEGVDAVLVFELSEVVGQAEGVAGDVDEPGGRAFQQRVDKARGEAAAGRIDNDAIEVGSTIFQKIGGVPCFEGDVFHSIEAGVGDGVSHGFRVEFH